MREYKPGERYYNYNMEIYPLLGRMSKNYLSIVRSSDIPGEYIVLFDELWMDVSISKEELDETFIEAEIEFDEAHHKRCRERREKSIESYISGEAEWLPLLKDVITELHISNESPTEKDEFAYNHVMDTISGKEEKVFIQ